MGRKFLIIAAGAFTVLIAGGAAVAAPVTMQLSSWQPVYQDGLIVSGTQTITLTNITQAPLDNVSFTVEPRPCECSVESWTATVGSLDGSQWTIVSLDSNATATLTIEYVDATAVYAGTSTTDSSAVGRIASVFAIGLVLGGLFLSRPSRFRITV